MRQIPVYPYCFEPILKWKPWGVSTLRRKGFGLDRKAGGIGESWEISEHGEEVSVVANGPLAGATLRELIHADAGSILGQRVVDSCGVRLPLLLKTIRAAGTLSLQVHPGGDSPGGSKTEAWYVLDAQPGAKLIAGLRYSVRPHEFKKALSRMTPELGHLMLEAMEPNSPITRRSRRGRCKLGDVLRIIRVNPGDSVFLRPGTLHAIGPGMRLYEIQEASNVTYRLYDWHRRDAHGRLRALHLNKGLQALDHERKVRLRRASESLGRRLLVNSDAFVLEHFRFRGTLRPVEVRRRRRSSTFEMVTALSKSVEIKAAGASLRLAAWKSALVPAAVAGDELQLRSAGPVAEVLLARPGCF